MTSVQQTTRLASIDILRALTMVLMIFVNDLWSLENIPLWLEHVPADADNMGLADVVFPAFLFIVGMSIPFAIASRKKRGETKPEIIKHIVIRSVALITMGLFLVNGEYINEEASGISRLLWNVLSCTAFILIWNSYPISWSRYFVSGSKIAGVILLAVLAVLYRGGESNDIKYFSTYWWGILGLIGWSYLVCSVIFALAEGSSVTLIIAFVAFNLLCVGNHLQLYAPSGFFAKILAPFGEGSMPSLVMGGTLMSMIYVHFKMLNQERKMLAVLTVIALAWLIIGVLTRPAWGISKIRATPSWVWICSSITLLAFMFIYWLADIKKKSNWFLIIKPAGTNTLLCYLIPYFAYTIVATLQVPFPEPMLTGITGLVKSFAFAILVVLIAGFFEKRGLQLKL